MRRRVGRRTGWSVLGAALLALIWGFSALTSLGDGGSGPQGVEIASVEGMSLLPGLGETAVGFGSPLEEQVADATPLSDVFELDAGQGGVGRLAWADGELVSAQFPNVPLPGGIEPDFGQASEPPAGDAMLAAFGDDDDAIAGLVPDSLGSFVGGAGNFPGGGGASDGPGFPDNPNGPQLPVPEPSPVDLLQIALALLAGLAYRRFRA